MDYTKYSNEDLVQVALEVYARSCTHLTKSLHDAAMAAKQELLSRLGGQLESPVKPANDVIKIIDEMIAASKQVEIAELDADEDCDDETLIDHQGRIYALTILKNRLNEIKTS